MLASARMTRYTYYSHLGLPNASSPPQFGRNTLPQDSDEPYPCYYDGVEMRPSHSHCSMGSAPWNDSPDSFDTSFLSNYHPQNEFDVAPIVPPAPFESVAFNGTWISETYRDTNLPMTLFEHDMAGDSQMMFDLTSEPSFSHDELMLTERDDAANDHQAPPDAVQGASASYSTLAPPASGPVLTQHSGKTGYQCQVENCTTKTVFTRKTDLNRHHRSLHSNVRFDCAYSWCGRTGAAGFSRQDHYLEHCREVHQDKSNPRVRRKQPVQ